MPRDNWSDRSECGCEDRKYDWEERAAILEFDAGHSRLDAERIATEILGYCPA